jgi:hypothetical protein
MWVILLMMLGVAVVVLLVFWRKRFLARAVR